MAIWENKGVLGLIAEGSWCELLGSEKAGARFEGAKRDYWQDSRRFAIPGPYSPFTIATPPTWFGFLTSLLNCIPRRKPPRLDVLVFPVLKSSALPVFPIASAVYFQ
jgi:NADH:ubiquinone oxidoreductase subunit